jgi:hypothetical protein
MATPIQNPWRRTELPLVAGIIAFLGAGCSYPNQFRSLSADLPHAVLVGNQVKAFHINQQPTSFWRTRESFRIPPGPTTVRPVTGHWEIPEYPAVEFTAVAGHRYSLSHKMSNGCHKVFVREQAVGSTGERVVAEVEANPRK